MNSSFYNTSKEFKECACKGCKNKPTTVLQIMTLPDRGYYCPQCASDLKWHGIAQEVEQEDG